MNLPEAKVPSDRLTGAFAMLGATFAFGAAGGTVSGSGVSGMFVIAVAFPISGLATLAILLIRRQMPVSFSWRSALFITLPFFAQSALYLSALRLGPPGPIAAIHLLSPIILLCWYLFRRKRSFRLRESIVGSLLIAAALSVVLLPGSVSGGSNPLLGLALSLCSAVCSAIMLVQISHATKEGPSAIYNALCQIGAGALAFPFALTSDVDHSDVLRVVFMGLVFFPVGMALMFSALGRISTVAVGALGLMEAPFTALIATILFSKSFSPQHAITMALVLTAAVIEITRQAELAAIPHGIKPPAIS